MKKLLLNLAICSTLPLCAATAFGADTCSNYVSGQLGVVSLMDGDITEPGFSGEAQYDTGWGIGGAVGHDFGSMRAELEFTYRINDFDEVSALGTTTSADGDMTSLALMLNGYYDFENSSSVTPYLMGGLGFARVEANDLVLSAFEVGSADDMVFAYQLGAGIGFKVSNEVTLDLAYRYFATSDPEFDVVGGGTTEMEYGSHNIIFGVRVAF